MARHSRIPRRGGSSHELYGLETYATAASAGAVDRNTLCPDLAGESLGHPPPYRELPICLRRLATLVCLQVSDNQSKSDSDAAVGARSVVGYWTMGRTWG